MSRQWMISGFPCAGLVGGCQQTLADRGRDRRLAGAYMQFSADIADVKIGGAFADVQDAANFPAGLALCRPVQAVVFSRAQALHVSGLPAVFIAWRRFS